MSPNILITTDIPDKSGKNHTKWLYSILNLFLKDILKNANIIYGDFSKNTINKNDLIIGFELLPNSKELLTTANKTFIDIRISPIRYLDDIFFTFETNSDPIKEKLYSYEIEKKICQLHADLICATTTKLKKDQLILPNSLLLIGQTEKDRVTFDGDTYLSLLDRIDKIKQIAINYDHIYFKPHPYAKNNRHILRKLRKEFGEVKSTHENIYHLLSNDGVKHVIALNSSVLYEAVYFNKKTTFLFSPTFTEKQIGAYGDYLTGLFWSDILSPIFETSPSSLSLPFQPSRMRKILNDFWGYNEISDEIIFIDILKSKVKQFLARFIR